MLDLSLHLEATRSSASTGTLKFAALALNIWFLQMPSLAVLLQISRLCQDALTLCLCGPNPKCLTASLCDFGPLNKIVFSPFGFRCAKSSSVRHSPPALTIRARAVAVKRSAAISSFGTLSRRLSSVTVATTTMVLVGAGVEGDVVVATMRESEMGARLVRDWKRRRRTTWLKGESVRPGSSSEAVRAKGRGASKID